MKKIREERKTLVHLLTVTFIWGILIQIGSLLLAGDKLYFTIGLWCGVVIAMGMAFHMQRSLEDALDVLEGAEVKLRKAHMFRYTLIGIVFVALAYFKIGGVIACFLGIIGLKAAALSEPLWKKYFSKKEK